MTARPDARRHRRLAEDEASLWARAMTDVKPLARAPATRRRPGGPAIAPTIAGVAPDPIPATADPPLLPPPRPAFAPPVPAAGLATGLDRKTLARLRRGDVAIAARLDLHGMTQAHAHAELDAFLDRAVRRGARLVLIISGKGNGGDGILRRMLPRWIQAGPHRARVLGVEPAHARHGGDGAWYVQLRRPRGGPTT
jgi:DNA-nicking Smr family endonuclease